MSSIELPTSPDVYKQKIADVKSTFSVKLDPVVNAYMNTKLNPNITEYQTTYDTVLNGIHETQSKMFELKNEISTALEVVTAKNEEYVRTIEQEKRVETNINNKINSLNNVRSGSAGLRKNMTDTYKLQYASNFFMIIGLIITTIVIYFVFGKDIISGQVSISPIPIQNQLN